MTEQVSSDGPTANELEQLRDILYGQQARSTDVRFKELNQHLATLRSELSDRLDRQNEAQSQTAQANYAALSARLDALQQALTAQLAQMAADSAAQLAQARQQLNERLEALHDETNRQNAALNADLSALAATLEDKKISRQAFGQLLAELAERLQNQAV